MERINYALESFKNIQDLIKFTDQKAGAILVLVGLAFTGYLDYLSGLQIRTTDLGAIGFLTFITSLTSIVSMTVTICYSVFGVLLPRKAMHYDTNVLSTFYSSHLAQIGKVEIRNVFESISDQQMLHDILDQQFEVAVILEKKNASLRKGLIWMAISLVSVIAFILIRIQL